MMYEQKRCHFCDKLVPVKLTEDGYLLFKDCYCCPDGSYRIQEEMVEKLNQLPPAQKREQFFLISGWIRESLERDPNFCITDEVFEHWPQSVLIPRTMDEKKHKLLLYLFRRTSGPEEMETLQHMNNAYNITYSPNLQEFIYIIEQLRASKWLDRRGASIALTRKGWDAAKKLTEHRESRQCFIAMSLDPELLESFKVVVLPKLKESGYEPVTAESLTDSGSFDKAMMEIRKSELVIADFTQQKQNVYFAAGFAKGLGLTVIGTVRKDQAADLPVGTSGEGPIVWETPEELAEKLHSRIADFSWGNR